VAHTVPTKFIDTYKTTPRDEKKDEKDEKVLITCLPPPEEFIVFVVQRVTFPNLTSSYNFLFVFGKDEDAV
jgi:hypothetical protein